MIYASAVLAPYAKSQLDRLDVIQKIAARIIMEQPSDAHAAPLLETLRLPSLESRRRDHVVDLVEGVIGGLSHPALADYFNVGEGGRIRQGVQARIGIWRKRFRYHAALTYNECRSALP